MEGDREGCFCFQLGLERESRRASLVLPNPFILHLPICLPAVMLIPTGICTSQLEQGKSSEHSRERHAVSEHTTNITARLRRAQIGVVDLKS